MRSSGLRSALGAASIWIRSKGDAYREYQKRVSKFILLPPKRA